MKILQHLPVLVIVVPLISCVVIPIVGRVNRFACWVIATVISFFCFLGSVQLLNIVTNRGKISYWLGGWEPPWGIEYVIDHLNAFVLVVISFI